MKKIIAIALVALLTVVSVFAQAASETQSSTTKIVVGATPEPHAALLSLVVDDLAAQGITLEIKEFTDYVTPNDAVEYGEIDANYFQHIPLAESMLSLSLSTQRSIHPSLTFQTVQSLLFQTILQTKEELFFSWKLLDLSSLRTTLASKLSHSIS